MKYHQFDTINKFYKDILKSHNVKSQKENTKQNKRTVLKNASLLFYELINMCKKEYEQVLKLKMKTEGKNDYKNPKDFSYQVDKTKKEEDKKKKNIK